jgi:hypothetical protein
MIVLEIIQSRYSLVGVSRVASSESCVVWSVAWLDPLCYEHHRVGMSIVVAVAAVRVNGARDDCEILMVLGGGPGGKCYQSGGIESDIRVVE